MEIQQSTSQWHRSERKKWKKYKLSVPHFHFPCVNGNKSFFVLSNSFLFAKLSLHKKLVPKITKILFLTIQQRQMNFFWQSTIEHVKYAQRCWKLVSLFALCLVPHRMWLCERMVRIKSTERKWLFIFKFIVQLPFDDPSFILPYSNLNFIQLRIVRGRNSVYSNNDNVRIKFANSKKKKNLKNVRCRIKSSDRNSNYLSGARRVNFNMYSTKFFNSSYNSVGSIASLSFFSRFVYRKWNLNKNILYRAHPSVYFIEFAINNFFFSQSFVHFL